MILAAFGALLVGVSLGLLGSGGAILTVPILVYLVGHPEKPAIIESLAIVGAIALVGAIRNQRAGTIDLRTAAMLAFPGIVGSWFGAQVSSHVSGAVQLVLLAMLMIVASGLMLRPAKTQKTEPVSRANTFPAIAVLAGQGAALGFVTGFVGVGGGFLLIPALVLIRRLAMPVAVGTSLAVIFVNCCAGLAKHVSAKHPELEQVDWSVVGMFALLGILGSLLGGRLGTRINPRRLKQVFAVFLLGMAAFVIWQQAPKVL